MRIAGILLGGGRSERFGGKKLEALLGGRRLVDIACANFVEAGLDPVLFAGTADPSVPGVLAVAPPRPTASMIETLRLALDRLPGGPFCFAPADLPFLSPPLVRRLREEFERGGAEFLIPTHGGRRGHPAFARSPNPFRIAGDREGPREIFRAAGDSLRLVEAGTADILYDIDTTEDLEAAADPGSRRRRLVARGDLLI